MTQKIRHITYMLFATMTVITLFSCNGNGTDPPPPVKINAPMRYFPIQQGNTWYYNNDAVFRVIEGQITINGVVCERMIQNDAPEEGWTLTAERFAQHMLQGRVWFDPPLQIPFSLEKDKPHSFRSLARGFADTNTVGIYEGTITFLGYGKQEVSDVMLDSCLRLGYHVLIIDPDTTILDYEEFYARDIGLVTDGDIYLDSAIIQGVKVP